MSRHPQLNKPRSHKLNVHKVGGVFHQFRQVFGLHENCIKVRIGQSEVKVDILKVLQVTVRPKLRSRLSKNKVLSVRGGHFHGSTQQLAVQR